MENLSKKQLEETRNTFEDYALYYAKNIEWQSTVAKKFLNELLLPFLDLVSEYSSTNIPKLGFWGCGSGRNTYLTLVHGNYDCYGYDLSKKMISEFQRRVSGGNIFLADVSKYKFTPNFFDGVVAESVLSYLTRAGIEKALKSLYKSLKIGGVAHLGFKVDGGSVVKDTYLPSARYYIAYSMEEIRVLLQRHGFKIYKEMRSIDPLRKKVVWYDVFIVK